MGQASGEAPPAAIHDEYESGPELEEIVGPADPGPVDYAPRPEDQADLWEGLLGPEEEGSLGWCRGEVGSTTPPAVVKPMLCSKGGLLTWQHQHCLLQEHLPGQHSTDAAAS